MARQPTGDEKVQLHPRNKHRNPYDFHALVKACPELSQYVFLNPYNNLSVDFKNPDAVKVLNKALLISFYNIRHWNIPPGYLCPPIPGRADYIHYTADLLALVNNGMIPRGRAVKVLDIGVGANCIYPLLGHREYGWSFTGCDIDDTAILSAKNITEGNALSENIEIRKQPSKAHIFTGIIQPGERFDITLCNPPFHASANEALATTRLKWKKLGLKKEMGASLNFGGRNNELWYEGGEEMFVRKMIAESVAFAQSCLWFTSLISKKETLKGCYAALEKMKARQIKTINMAQGKKSSRILAWTFMDVPEQEAWASRRWANNNS